MTGPGAEMPFLDHLEELRARLIRSILAIVAGCIVGFMVVQRFELVGLISRPIQPYLGTGETSTDARAQGGLVRPPSSRYDVQEGEPF